MQHSKTLEVQKWASSWRGFAAILGLTIGAYFPLWRAGFVWDDVAVLTDNPWIHAADGLRTVWFQTDFPLTLAGFWCEWRLWGNHPFGYHLINVLLHVVNATLLWRVLRLLRIRGAWLAGVVFAVHPVCVASVAWISEFKNTLSLLFCLLSFLWYLRADERKSEIQNSKYRSPLRTSHFAFRTSRWYWLSLFAFLLALLSKTTVVVLPLVLLLCCWWRQGRVTSRNLLRVAPFFGLAIVFGLLSVWFQTHQAVKPGAPSPDHLTTRLIGGSWALWFYLFKAVLPINLSALYPRWDIDPGSLISYVPGMAWVAALLLSWRHRRSWGRPVLFGMGYFTIALLPVLGVFDTAFFAYSRVADHWQYLALVGVVALASSVVAMESAVRQQTGVVNAKGRFPGLLHARACFSVRVCLTVGLIGALFFLTWQRAMVYRSDYTLWRDTIRKNPHAWSAHNNLGRVLAEQGRVDEAIVHYVEAVRLNTNNALAHYNWGNALAAKNNFGGAVEQFRTALRLNPFLNEAHVNLGNALAVQGRLDEAVRHYVAFLRVTPDDASAHNNLANALSQLGRSEDAIRHYSQALEFEPGNPGTHFNLGLVLAGKGSLREAAGHFSTALKLKPDYEDARRQLNLLNARLGH